MTSAPLRALAVEMQHLRAKSKSESGEGQPLITHLLDVCRQAGGYFRAYEPRCDFQSIGDLRRVLAYSALTHDFGKIHIRFQRMLTSGHPFGNRHEVLSLAFLQWMDAPEEELNWIAAAVATHHREISFIRDNYPFDVFDVEESKPSQLAFGVEERDARLLYRLLSLADVVFYEVGWDGIAAYPLRPYSGDWLGQMKAGLRRATGLVAQLSPRPSLRPGGQGEPNWAGVLAAIHARGWLLLSDHLASFGPTEITQCFQRKVDALGQIRQALKRRNRTVAAVLPSHQQAAADAKGSAFLVAPTGSGKTEAGLLWSARQAESGLRGKLLMVLPYQASMNAMQHRLIRDFFPDKLEWPERWNESVALVHGRTVRRIYELLAKGGMDDEDAAKIARLQAELARLSAAPLMVCSAFSLIRILFATKRAEELLASLWEARIVVDEVHAYEPDVTAMTLAGLRVLKERLGARALLMSATPAAHLLSAVEEGLDSGPPIEAGQDVLNRPARHRLNLLHYAITDQRAVELIRSRATSESVLVVVNQVTRAIAVFKKLRDSGLDVRLLHSRFNYADRSRIEETLDPVAGRVLVGTQAVEVSLDLDFDCCFSELAPIESLWQRFGRVNRYGCRPGADVHVFTRFPEGQNAPWLPYKKSHLFQVCETLTEKVAGDPSISAADTKLIDRSYPAELKDELMHALRRKTHEVYAAFVSGFRAFGDADMTALKNLEQSWEGLFDGYEVLPSQCIEKARCVESWIARARYLVPVSGSLFRRSGAAWDPELRCFVTDLPYDSTFGLESHRVILAR